LLVEGLAVPNAAPKELRPIGHRGQRVLLLRKESPEAGLMPAELLTGTVAVLANSPAKLANLLRSCSRERTARAPSISAPPAGRSPAPAAAASGDCRSSVPSRASEAGHARSAAARIQNALVSSAPAAIRPPTNHPSQDQWPLPSVRRHRRPHRLGKSLSPNRRSLLRRLHPSSLAQER
jgi:hypothetical protein